MRRTLVAAALLLAGLLVWHCTRPTVAPSRVADQPGPAPSEPGPTVPPMPASQRPQLQDSARSAAPIRILVESRDGRPLPGALLHDVSCEQRSHRVAQAPVLGRTDAEGCLTVARAQVQSKCVLALRPGYGPRSAEVPAAGDLVITLDAAGELRIACRTRDGQPVAGVAIAASEGHIPALLDIGAEWSEIPGGDRRTGLHFARTDGSGQALLPYLPRERLQLRLQHPDHVVVGGLPPGGVDLGAGNTALDVTLDPIFGVCATAAGIREESWRLKAPKGAATPFESLVELDRRRRQILQQSGAAAETLCALWSPEFTEDGGYARLPAEVPARVMTLSGAWVDTTLSVRPAVNLPFPEVVRLSPAPASSAALEIAVTAGGVPVRGFPLVIHGDADRLGMPLQGGSLVRLPAGDYVVRKGSAVLGPDLIEQQCSLRAGEVMSLEFQLPRPYVPCRFDLRDEAGIRLTAATLRCSFGESRASIMVAHGLEHRVFWLPAGAVALEIQAEACRPLQSEVTIGMTPDGGPVELALLLERGS